MIVGLAAACADSPSPVLSPSLTAARLTLSASPDGTWRSGSSVRVTADLRASDTTRVAGRSVRFSTSAGALSAAVAETDALGQAAVDLVADQAATVTAVAEGITANLLVTSRDPVTVRVRPEWDPAPVGFSWLRVDVVAAPGAPRPDALRARCSEQDAWRAIEVTGGRLCEHREPGAHRASVEADFGGWTQRVVATVDVEPLTLIVRQTVLSSGPGGTTVAFDLANLSRYAVRYRWDFGDGRRAESPLPSGFVHTYSGQRASRLVVEGLNERGVVVAHVAQTVVADIR